MLDYDVPEVPGWEHNLCEKIALGEGLSKEEAMGVLEIMQTLNSLLNQSVDISKRRLKDMRESEQRISVLYKRTLRLRTLMRLRN